MDRLSLWLVPVVFGCVVVAPVHGDDGTGRSEDKWSRNATSLRAVEDALAELTDAESDIEGPPFEIDGDVAGGSLTSCDTVGEYLTVHRRANFFAGNIYRVEFDDVELHEIKMELDLEGTVDLYFSVHRASSDPDACTPRTFERVIPDVVCTVDGGNGTRDFYSCGQDFGSLPLPLEPGYDYLIGCAWGTTTGRDNRVTFANNSQPQPFLHGQVPARVFTDGPPPLDDEVAGLWCQIGLYSMELCFEPVEGACCCSTFPDVGCRDTLPPPQSCTGEGCFFNGERADCQEVACSFGACCLPCGECLGDYTEEACEGEGGTWAGRGVACQAGLCPLVTGACCEGGSCSEVCIDECALRNGEFRGHGTTCFPNFCAGACCVPGNSCTDLTSQVCQLLGGSFRDLGTTCAALLPEDECGGACCAQLSGQPICFTVNERSECTEQPPNLILPIYLGDALACNDEADAICADPTTTAIETGSCCLPDGSCVFGTSHFCSVAAGTFDEDALSCDGITCTTVCCGPPGTPEDPAECGMIPDTSLCSDFGLEPAIISADSCVPNPCDIVTGACCFGAPGFDLEDFADFQVCLSGPGPAGLDPQCVLFDMDGPDDDVDLADIAEFWARFTGGEAACEDDTTREMCEAAGGRFQEGDTDCVNDCPICLGACCRPSGACTDQTSQTECEDILGGEFQDCPSRCVDVEDACEQRGACCAETGTCVPLLLASECAAIRGEFAGVGEACSPDNCPAGACCLAEGAGRCELRRWDQCPADGDPLGTVYQGDESTCEPGVCSLGACCDETPACSLEFGSECDLSNEFSPGVDCSDPDTCFQGACCRNGSCSAQTLAACEEAGDVYQGRGLACEVDLCRLGRCCERDGSCRNDVVESQCVDTQGVFNPLITCESAAQCEQIGACCLRDGSCLDDLLTSQCEDADGTLTPDGSCDSITCIAVGACCNNGDCTSDEESQDQCVQSGGRYVADDSVCAPDLCTLGSCCELDLTCTDDLISSECDARNGSFRLLDCVTAPDCEERGACCLRDGDCVGDVLPLTCALAHGELTRDTECTVLDPPCEAVGACCVDSSCTEDTQAVCEGDGGVFQGDDTVCSAGSCPIGACCNGESCTQQSETVCVSDGGVYQGDEAPCTPGLCVLGACCHLDGTCDEAVVASECTDSFDVFSRFRTCAAECLGARGACCLGADCQDAKPELWCLDQEGGAYYGDDTLCQPDLCEEGACCLPGDGETCDATHTRLWCEVDGGAYQGADSRCDAGRCTLGSCCAIDATCTDDVVASQCEDPNVFREGQSCVDAPCAARGACCLPEDANCTIKSETDCVNRLLGTYGGDTTTCTADDLCDTGACCIIDYTCDPRTRMLCEQEHGIYQGAGIDCVLDAIDCERGTCCELDGTCRAGGLASSCMAPGSEFEPGAVCLGITCEPRGACCESGVCTIETRADCLVADGTYQGTGVACQPGTCPITITSSDPPNCTIDARQPSDPDGSTTLGWSSIDLTFDGDASAVGAGDFTVEVIPGPDGVPDIVNVTAVGNTATLELEPPIPPGQWTCFTYDTDGTTTCLGFLPADSTSDGVSTAADTQRVIDCVNRVESCEPWQCDLDRDGACAPSDILRSIDLLNGAQPYDVWLDASLPACPSDGS